MHYLLRQLSTNPDSHLPIEIHLRSKSVYVGRKQFKHLTRFPQISRQHAVFTKSDDGNIFVKDLNSLNGVYVNNTRIGPHQKLLKSGDVIGLGVSSSGTVDGFVCVLLYEDTDIEEIETTDEDRSNQKPNSRTSLERESDHNSVLVTSQNNNVCLPDIYDVPSVSKHQKHTLREVERVESSSQAKNRVTCYVSSNSDASESSGIGSISVPQNDIKKVHDKPVCRRETKSRELISLQKCFVRLVRCDDSSFQFPPGVKNPFKTGQIKLPLQPTKLTKQRDDSKAMKIISRRKRKCPRKLSTESSNDSDEYIPQNATTDKNIHVSAQSKTHRARYSVYNKHRRKKSRILSTDSSDDSVENISQSASSSQQHTSHSTNNKHRRKQSRKITNDFSDDSGEHIHQNKRSEASRNTNLLNNKHSRKQPKTLSSDSSGDSDKNADLVNSKQERKRRRNSSSVSSDCSGKIMYARTATTCVNADALNRDENDHTNPDNQVSGGKKTLPRDPDLEELNCERSSSKAEVKSTEMSYSEPDVFYISDNETYLDVNSSQDRVFVKKELETSSSDSDTFREIFGENSFPPNPKTVVREGHSDVKTESIESILAFIQEQKSPRDSAARVKRSVFHQEPAIPSVSGEQSPEHHSDSSIRSNDKDGSDEIRNSRGISPPIQNNKEIRKSAGRTLLTEPKPLSYVARKFRGRDENLVEKKKPQTQLSRGETSRSESKSSKFEDYNPPPPARKRISHLASKASAVTSKSSNLAPKDSSHPAQPNPVADVVEKNRVVIERTEYSQRHLRETENIASRPLPAKYAATDHKRVSVATAVGDHHKLSARLEGSNGVLRQLLQMNTRWLQEQITMREPPPYVWCGAEELPATFDSHESYTAMFRPLILLEIWERLFIEWREVEVDNGRNCKFQFLVLGHTERGDCVELECESVLAGGRSGLRVGDMAVLVVQEGPLPNQCTSLFGYVLGHRERQLSSNDVLKSTPWEQLLVECESSSDVLKHWTFRVCIKRKTETPSIVLNSLMKGYNLGCVRNLLDCADAFISIRDSPLLDTLLRPAQLNQPTSQRRPSFSQENLSYTSEQEAFIRTVSDIVVRGAAEPEIFLLGGAPGTGKTHVIMGMLERLLYRRSAGDIQVLVAAPSDTAIDEIGRRLIKLAQRYKKSDVRFVRVGHESQVDRQMVPYCASKLMKGVSVEEEDVLRRSHIVLSTLSGICAAHQLRPSLCIVDDASQCTEPEALQALVTHTSLLVLAGDPQQRSTRVLSRKARSYGLGRSLFERIMLSRPAHALSEQFRMHSEIARYPCPSYFPSLRRPNDRVSPLRPYLVLDLPDDENSRLVAIVCEFVCKVDSLAAVAALVSPSSRRVRFRTEATPLLRRHARRVEVRGPEGFLGREKDVVVLWAELPCPLRLRAAITRARRCLIVCVARQRVAHSYPFWADLLADAEKRDVLCVAPPNPDNLEKVLQRRLLLQPRSFIRQPQDVHWSASAKL